MIITHMIISYEFQETHQSLVPEILCGMTTRVHIKLTEYIKFTE